MSLLITHWAKLALLESAQRSHDVIQNVCNDAIYLTKQNSMRRTLRGEAREDGKTDVLFFLAAKDGVRTLDVRWHYRHSETEIIISPDSVTIESLPATMVSAYAHKVPFPASQLIDNSPYDVLSNRNIVEVTQKGNNAIFHLEVRPDCPPTDLRAWQKEQLS